jgi:hypothetical protein
MTKARLGGLPLNDVPQLRAQAFSLSGGTAAADNPGGRNAAVRI